MPAARTNQKASTNSAESFDPDDYWDALVPMSEVASPAGSRAESLRRGPVRRLARFVGVAALAFYSLTTTDSLADRVYDKIDDPKELVVGLDRELMDINGVDVRHVDDSRITLEGPWDVQSRIPGLDVLSGTNMIDGVRFSEVDHISSQTTTGEDFLTAPRIKATIYRVPENHSSIYYLDDYDSDIPQISRDVANYNNNLETTYSNSVESVGNLLTAIDQGDADYVNQEAAKFNQQYEDELHTQEEVSQTLELIKNAENSDEVLAALNEFTQSYDVHVSVEKKDQKAKDITSGATQFKEKNLGNLKKRSADTVRFLGLFPVSVFGDIFELEEIVFGGQSISRGRPVGGFAAFTDTGRWISVSTNRYAAPDNVIAHEIAHTSSGDQISPRDKNRVTGDMPGAGSGLIAEILLGQKKHESDYAVSGGIYENHAEVVAGMLGDRGFIRLDRAYTVGEELRRERAAVLVLLENTHPGISAHLAKQLDVVELPSNPILEVGDQKFERFSLALAIALGLIAESTSMRKKRLKG